MKKIVYGLVLGGVLTGLYLYGTSEVPGGEKRYEQFVRLVLDRHGADIPKI
jgi:hypothetical protein